MLRSLVGSEMCIRDSHYAVLFQDQDYRERLSPANLRLPPTSAREQKKIDDAMRISNAAELDSKLKQAGKRKRGEPKCKQAGKKVDAAEDSDLEDSMPLQKQIKKQGPVKKERVKEPTKRKRKAEKAAAQKVVLESEGESSGDDEDDEARASLNLGQWVECHKCRQWRRWTSLAETPSEEEKWYCHLNNDRKYNQCSVPQELSNDAIDEEIEEQSAAPHPRVGASAAREGQAQRAGKKLAPKESKKGKRKLEKPAAKQVVLESDEESSEVDDHEPPGPIREADPKVSSAPPVAEPIPEPAEEVRKEKKKRSHEGHRQRGRRSGDVVVSNISREADLKDVHRLMEMFGRVSRFKAGVCQDQGSQVAVVTFEDYRQANAAADNLPKLSIHRMGLRCFRKFDPIL
eukprot:TRINITY_DN20280_c0_g2_i1.p1 TRINITY_DN20280_c0_g2~~TRINITY_DN20280_c0_g2_i1.p1  ORF type:complete len:402 (+),score=104.72 TRINITY_DN20280_c0_g2_i1:141-1346(+)